MNSAQPTAKHYLKQFVGSYFPSLFYPKIESDKIFPLGKNFKNLLEETGYFHIQATKPDTVGETFFFLHFLNKFFVVTIAFKNLADYFVL